VVVVKEGATQIAKYYISKDPSAYLVFDLQKLAEDYVRVDLTDATDPAKIIFELPHTADWIMSPAPEGCKQLTIEFGEVYGNPLVEYLTLITETIFLVDGITPYSLGINYNYPDYQASSATQKVWLTEREVSVDNPLGESCIVIHANEEDFGVIGFWNDTVGLITSSAQQIQYRIFDAVGVQGTDTILIAPANGIGLPSSSDAEDKLAYLGMYPANLNSADSPFNPLFAPSAISGWTHYTIRLLDGTINPMSRKIIVVNTEGPCKNLPATLYWTNSLGSWEAFKFYGRTDIEISSQSKNYIKPIFNSTTRSFNSFDRQETQFGVDNTEMITLRTGVISNSERTLLSKVVKSKDVYVLYAGSYIPVVAKTSSMKVYELRSKIEEVEMTFTVAQQEI